MAIHFSTLKRAVNIQVKIIIMTKYHVQLSYKGDYSKCSGTEQEGPKRPV